MHPVRFVYFDLDDTLLDHRHAEKQALADLCRTFGAHFGRFAVEHVQETYHAHNVALWRRYSLGEISKDDLKRLRFEQLLEALAIDALEPVELNTHYLDRYARYWTFGEAARRAFHAIADRYPVGVLTNGFAEIQQAKLARFPDLHERLSALVVSEEVGYLKPDRRLFDHAARIAGVPAEQILYVGDSYPSDVQGALRAGWQAAWYTSEPAAEPGVFRFDDWQALVGVLSSAF